MKGGRVFYTATVVLIILASWLSYIYVEPILNSYIYRSLPNEMKYNLVRHVQLFIFSYSFLLIYLMAGYIGMVSLKKSSISVFEACILISVILAIYGIEYGKVFAVPAWGKDNVFNTLKLNITYIYIVSGVVFVLMSFFIRYIKNNIALRYFSAIAPTVLALIVCFNLTWYYFLNDLHAPLSTDQIIKIYFG